MIVRGADGSSFCAGDEPEAVVQARLQTTAPGDRPSSGKLACEMDSGVAGSSRGIYPPARLNTSSTNCWKTLMGLRQSR